MAIALVGLICAGVVLVGGVLFTRQSTSEQNAAVAPPPAEPETAPTPIPSATATASPTATNTPLPTSTSTPVVGSNPGEGEAVAEGEEDSGSILPTAKATLDPAEVTPVNTLVVSRDPTSVSETTEETTQEATSESAAEDKTSAPEQMPVGGGVTTGDNLALAWAGVIVLLILLIGITARLKSASWW